MRTPRLLLPAFLACAILAGGLSLHAQGRLYTTEQIDQMVAPIALYPDALMSQVLMAATFPDQVSDADSWVRANQGLTGPELDDALATATWDPSVIALCKFPSVLDRMADNIRWTTDLGYAFLDQRADVMSACQTLRRAAYQEGHLRTTPQQRVVYEDQTIVIQPYSPGVIYVPAYQPAVVFGPVWSYPTYYYPRVWAPSPSYSFVNGFAWGLGFAVGNILFGGCDWNHHDVYVNNSVIVNNSIYRNTGFYQQAELHPAYGRQTWTHYADRASYARGGTGAPYEGRSYGRVRGLGPAGDRFQAPGAERAHLQQPAPAGRYEGTKATGSGPSRYSSPAGGRPAAHGPEGYRSPREAYTAPRSPSGVEPRAPRPEGYRSPRESNAAPRGSSGAHPPTYAEPPAGGPARRGEGANAPRVPGKTPEHKTPKEQHAEPHGPSGTPAPAASWGRARGPVSPWAFWGGRSETRAVPGAHRPAVGLASGMGVHGATPAPAPRHGKQARRRRI